MIPAIGLMIGCYIFTRMLSLLSRDGERKESPAVKVFAGITMVVTVFMVIDLLVAGSKFSQSFPS